MVSRDALHMSLWNKSLLIWLFLPQVWPFVSPPITSPRRQEQTIIDLSHSSASCPTATARFLSTRPDYWQYPEDNQDAGNEYAYRDEKFVGGSQAERELKNMRPSSFVEQEDDDDDYYLNDQEIAKLERPRNGRQSPRRADLDYYYNEAPDGYDNDDYYYNDEEENEAMGNFWSNPTSSLDPTPLARPSSRPPLPSRSRSVRGLPPTQRRGNKKRTTFRSGIPEPPPPVTDFYNRLFWYGFDPNDTADASPADNKTMFGGTKGKFNGLAFLYDGGPKMPAQERRRKPRRESIPENEIMDEDDYYLFEPDIDDDVDADVDLDYSPPAPRREVDANRPSSRRFAVTPPYDRPEPRQSERLRPPPTTTSTSSRSRRGGPRARRREIIDDDDEYYDNRRRERRSSQVSSWFNVDAEMDNDFVGSSSSLKQDQIAFNPFEIFLGRNRDDLNRQAAEYNRQMGLDGGDYDDSNGDSPAGRRRQRNPQRPRRAGFAYRYNAEEDESDEPPVAEFETVLEEDNTVNEGGRRGAVAPVNDKANQSTTRRTLTWEERSMAIERVPPVDVPAWGPSGALGVDARSHAIAEATQDFLQSQRRVQAREAKVEKAREDLSILKVDVELERKRLRQQRADPRRMQQQMRELDLDVDHTARALRYAQLQLQTAREELADVEIRHWGVLSFYDPKQVENGIDAAFRELEETEPAARRFREKMLQEQKQREEEEEAAAMAAQQQEAQASEVKAEKEKASDNASS